MEVILDKVTQNFPEDLQLAIVIAGTPITRTDDQRHAGFVVRSDDGRLWLFDLAWHNIFRQTEITHEYAYLVSDFLDPFEANAVIGFLANLYNENKGRLPYSINYEDGEYFDATTGQCLKTELGQGLTCATFVLAVLARYGIELIDISTWPKTEENKQWQEQILKKLIDTTRPPDTIDTFLTQFSMVGSVPRVRPEEAVGAASCFQEEALHFNVVSPAAAKVVEELNRLGLS
ncbi:hypothetical protein [Janthinobacterium sp. P210006]|uniref:hypothetical protein n=1 Tax=Janthinobacterium sp. P210006 TaxID=3112939 RepID=UPI002E2566D4|nr:hypothetical protein [Janthinobacterium sp. P210006]